MEYRLKNPLLLFLFVISAFMLAACSSAQSAPPSTPVQATQTQPATQTTIAETVAATSPAATETSTLLSTASAAIEMTPTPTEKPTEDVIETGLADVISVVVSGNENAYQFSVEIRSPDTGCEQYADWWEVVSEDGELIYRRILLHSHVNEQPFTRSGGPAAISADTVVIVRAHMNTDGYGGTAFKGSVNDGFGAMQLGRDFAEELEGADPLPSGCAF